MDERPCGASLDGRDWVICGKPAGHDGMHRGFVDRTGKTYTWWPQQVVGKEPCQASGVKLIAAERQRQVDVEGWTSEHDDEHFAGEMAAAAACYAFHAVDPDIRDLAPEFSDTSWPWSKKWWKPSADPIRNLVKAGALIAAEIDRLQRAASRRP